MPMTVSVSADGTTATLMGTVTIGQQALQLPTGTTAQRPTTPVDGFTRFNTTLGVVEMYLKGFWLTHGRGFTEVVGYTSMSTYGHTGSLQTHTVPSGHKYAFIKLWGAGGGGGSYGGWRNAGPGGGGGYTEGIVPVEGFDIILIRVGGPGHTRWSVNKAYPDGGACSTYGYDNQYCAAGGGSSSVAVPRVNTGEWCMFAGGGGGGASVNGYATSAGGAGGGICGENANIDLAAYLPLICTGRGGSQTAGGKGASNPNIYYGADGMFQQGANYPNYGCYGGGGGGGWYGGGSGGHSTDSGMGSGGGGSGYVHPDVIAGTTIGGNGQRCGNGNDPVLSNFIGSDYRVGRGGEEGASGGIGAVVIYTV